MIQILAESFELIPPTKVGSISEVGMFYIEHIKIIFDLAIKIAAPILFICLLKQ